MADQNTSSVGWTRRRVVAAGVWSAPVIALAVAVPHAAASPSRPSIILRDAVDDAATYAYGSTGDTIPLIFDVTGPDTTATATLVGASGIAAWDESLPAMGGDTTSSSIDAGTLILPIVVVGPGTFQVSVQLASIIKTFVITLVPA